MFIQTDTTPNPASLKFSPGMVINNGEAVGYSSIEEAKNSPLAQALFSVKEVTGVFIGKDFVTVSKNDDKSWDVLKPQILMIIMDHLSAGKAIFTEESNANNSPVFNENDSEIVKQIKEIIETRVRPAVAQDGGDIVFHEFTDDGILRLELRGACSGCPSSTVTLKNGIENMLKYYVPEVVAVEAI